MSMSYDSCPCPSCTDLRMRTTASYTYTAVGNSVTLSNGKPLPPPKDVGVIVRLHSAAPDGTPRYWVKSPNRMENYIDERDLELLNSNKPNMIQKLGNYIKKMVDADCFGSGTQMPVPFFNVK